MLTSAIDNLSEPGIASNQMRRTDHASTAPRSRLDRAVPLSAAGAIRTPEGYIRAPVRIAKPGVMVYMEGGRAVRELVPESTLSDPAWLASMEGKPITLHHPDTMVGPDNIRQLQVGTLLPPVRYEDGYVVGDAMISDADALRAVEAGTAEVSPGYDVEIAETPGVDPTYGAYDRIQTRRHGGNHLALTDRARGGPDIRLKLRADAVESTPAPESPMAASSPLLVPILLSLMLDPSTFADDAAAANAIAAKIGEMKAGVTLAAEAAEAADEMAAAPAMVAEVVEAGPVMPTDGMKMDSKRRDARAANHARTFTAIQTARKERNRLDADALAAGLDAAETDKLGNAALRKAIVLKLNPNARTDGSADYYAAALDMARSSTRTDAAGAVTGAEQIAALTGAGIGTGTRTDAAATPALTPSAASARAMGFPSYAASTL